MGNGFRGSTAPSTTRATPTAPAAPTPPRWPAFWHWGTASSRPHAGRTRLHRKPSSTGWTRSGPARDRYTPWARSWKERRHERDGRTTRYLGEQTARPPHHELRDGEPGGERDAVYRGAPGDGSREGRGRGDGEPRLGAVHQHRHPR